MWIYNTSSDFAKTLPLGCINGSIITRRLQKLHQRKPNAASIAYFRLARLMGCLVDRKN